eukprot:9477891-Pyramimonas_sp.AAC.2
MLKLGLHEMSDFTDESGTRILTQPKMRGKYRFSAQHETALRKLKNSLNCENTILPKRHLQRAKEGQFNLG